MQKRVLSLILLIAVQYYCIAAPRDVVWQFGNNMSSWCVTDDVSYRAKIEDLCSGVKSCRVEDKIHADYQRKRGYMDYETYFLDSYLNMFQTLISSGVRFSLSNIVVETQDTYPDGQTLTFITADVKVSGKINYNVKDLFLVRDNKISGIYNYSSKYGFQHLNGSLISELKRGKYTSTSGFQWNNLAKVYRDGKNALIDRKGKILVPLTDSYISYDTEGKFASVDNVYYDLRRGGKILPIQYFWTPQEKWTSEGMAIVAKGVDRDYAKIGYLREDDYTYQDVIYKYDDATHFKYGVACVQIGERTMLIDKNFNVLLRDNSTFEFIPNFTCVITKNLFNIRSKSSGLCGIVNLNGEIVVPCKYDWIGMFNDGFAGASKNGIYYIINTQGSVVAKLNEGEYFGSDVGRANHGLFMTVKEVDGKRLEGFINTNGNYIIKPGEYNISSTQYGDVIINGQQYIYIIAEKIVNGVKYEILLDKYGKIFPGFTWKYHSIGIFDECGLAYYEVDGKYGFINIRGEVVIPASYDKPCYFHSGFACVAKRINGEYKFGAINTDGTLVIPYLYQSKFEFDNGIALVEKDGKVGLIDPYGNSYFFE